MPQEQDSLQYIMKRITYFESQIQKLNTEYEKKRKGPGYCRRMDTYVQGLTATQASGARLGAKANLIRITSKEHGRMYLTGISLKDSMDMMQVMYPKHLFLYKEISPKKWLKSKVH